MGMTPRERLMTTLRGGRTDRIPWSIYPRLLEQGRSGDMFTRRGLGIWAHTHLCRAIHEDMEIVETRTQEAGQPLIQVRIETPVGTLTEESTLDPHYQSRWTRKFFISGPEDYGAAEYYFRHTRYEPYPQSWIAMDRDLGDRGIAMPGIMALPILILSQYWMGIEGMAEGLYLYRDRFDVLIDTLDQHYLRHAEIATASPAEVIWFPESISGRIISPELFRRYCLPLYARTVPLVHGAGKVIAAHYDGSIRPYLELLADVKIDCIEAFTPPPMGDLGVAEAKAAWPDKVIGVNFPGPLYHEPFEVIKAYTLDLLQEAAPGGRLIMGCSENFPIPEFVKTFTAIGQALAEYEGYPW